MTHEPDLRELVGEDLTPDEEERLQRVHGLLVAAGPPPELPPTLQTAPIPGQEPPARVLGLPQRHRGRMLTLALGFAAVTLVVGYLFGARSGGFNTDFSVQMSATPAAPHATAVVDVGKLDRAGNWPLRVQVTGLRKLAPGGYYELSLTQKGQPNVSCGTFRVHSGTTEVRLNAPYNFKHYDGWVVTAHPAGQSESPPLLRVNHV
jgi:hypothetical protein